MLAVITVLNLRGTGEAGLAFALPTYTFLGTMAVVLGWGVIRAVTAGGRPQPVVAPPALPAATEAVGLWILLRAFASGCTAMTGVEAVSNGVSAFRQPTVKNAQLTLTVIVVALALLLGGIAYVARAYQIGAMNQETPGYQSVLSQLTSAVIGRGWFYYVTIASVLATLCLSANTSFVGFPRLSRLIAQDDFLPRAFAIVGRRLVYSAGILFLAGAAGLLLVVFRGITDRLIPLFAVGAFLAFTLSQAGMVLHWRTELKRAEPQRDPHHREAAPGHGRGAAGVHVRLWVNAVGAIATGVALAVILAAKFTEGAWITVLAIPALLTLFKLVNRHYRRLEEQTSARRAAGPGAQPAAGGARADQGVGPADGQGAALRDVALDGRALRAPDEPERRRGRRGRRTRPPRVGRGRRSPRPTARRPPPRLVIAQSPYRRFVRPLLREIDRAKQEFPGRLIAVVVPEVVETRWWELLLHRRKPARLRSALLKRGDRRVVVINVPWYVEE